MSFRNALRPAVRALRSVLGTNGVGESVRYIVESLENVEQRLAQLQAPSVQERPPETFAMFTLPNGAKYEVSIDAVDRDAYHQSVAAGTVYDDSSRFLTRWIRRGDVFFDLGANIGTVSIPCAVLGAELHAFELLAENVQHLVRSLERNRIADARVVLGAISDQEGFIGFGGHSAWGTVVADAVVSIPTVVIDAYVRQRGIGHIDSMKLDIEGSEWAALRGAAEVIERDHPDIIIECNAGACANNGYSYRELLRFLEGLGYQLYRFHAGRLCPHRIDDVQEVVYVDYLATVKPAAEVSSRSGWAIAPLTDEDIIASIETQAGVSDIHRQYVLAIRDQLPAGVVDSPRVRDLLLAWEKARDPVAVAILAKGVT
jgi:FkbM family methyltransferase